jgi:hypothetical protein
LTPNSEEALESEIRDQERRKRLGIKPGDDPVAILRKMQARLEQLERESYERD